MAVASERSIARPQTATAGRQRAKVLETVLQAVAYVVLFGLGLLMFVPFLFSLATSFKTSQEANQITFANMFWPENPTLQAYRNVFDSNVDRWFLNSVIVAAIWVVARAVFASMAGYAFARMQFPGKNLAFLMILSTLMVPGIVTIIPKFLILKELRLLDTYGALTVPFFVDAFGIFLMKQFFESIPGELEEAARVDGANRYRMFAQIILPNAMPALIALAIFSFQGSWNGFLEPLIYISNPDLYTLPLGMAFFRQANYTDWPVQMAIATITTVPVALVYIFFQRYFHESNTSSGIKG